MHIIYMYIIFIRRIDIRYIRYCILYLELLHIHFEININNNLFKQF